MIKNTVSKIEAAVRSARGITPQKRAQLARLLSELRKEIRRLPKAHAERAESIAGFAQIATHEAARARRSRKLMQLSRQGLGFSVKGFEASHPALVKTVGEICRELASIGI